MDPLCPEMAKCCLHEKINFIVGRNVINLRVVFNKYMLFAGWEVRMLVVKNCERDFENAMK